MNRPPTRIMTEVYKALKKNDNFDSQYEFYPPHGHMHLYSSSLTATLRLSLPFDKLVRVLGVVKK